MAYFLCQSGETISVQPSYHKDFRKDRLIQGLLILAHLFIGIVNHISFSFNLSGFLTGSRCEPVIELFGFSEQLPEGGMCKKCTLQSLEKTSGGGLSPIITAYWETHVMGYMMIPSKCSTSCWMICAVQPVYFCRCGFHALSRYSTSILW